jgi:hypothetical protein
MLVNALKSVTEEDFGFHSPENDYVVIKEWDLEDNPETNPEDNAENAEEAKEWVDVTANPDNLEQGEVKKKNDHALG